MINTLLAILLGGVLLYVIVKPFLPAYSTSKKTKVLKLREGKGLKLLNHKGIQYDIYYAVDTAEIIEEERRFFITTLEGVVFEFDLMDGLPILPQNIKAVKFRNNGWILIRYNDFEFIDHSEEEY